MFVDFIDELGSGIPIADTPAIRTELSLSYGEVSWFLLVVPLLAAMVLEPPLMLLSDRWSRRAMVTVGLAAMAVALSLAAWTASPWAFAGALALWASAGGLGVGVAQAALMAAYPDQREKMMTRWTLMGALGDAATPLLVAAVGLLGGNWRLALWVAAALHMLTAVMLGLGPFPPPRDPVEPDPVEPDPAESDERSLWKRLGAGLRNRALLVWLGASATCMLLDEIFVAFGTLFMRDELGGSLVQQSAMVFADALGCTLGLLLTDRLLARVSPRRLLIGAGTACALTYVAWLFTPWPTLSIALVFFVGLFCAPLYPLTQARAYACCPRHPGLVRAVDTIYAPLSVLAPLALGYLADRVSLVAALAVLLLQPLLVATVATLSRDAEPPPGPRAHVELEPENSRPGAHGADHIAADPPRGRCT